MFQFGRLRTKICLPRLSKMECVKRLEHFFDTIKNKKDHINLRLLKYRESLKRFNNFFKMLKNYHNQFKDVARKGDVLKYIILIHTHLKELIFSAIKLIIYIFKYVIHDKFNIDDIIM